MALVPDFSPEDLESLALSRVKREPADLEYLRDLTPADLAILQAGERAPKAPLATARIRHSHHQLARLIVTGVAPTEASYITGYTTEYISMLQGDPAFQELLAHYSDMVTGQYVDVHARLSVLGLDTIEELAERLRINPAGFTVAQLLAMAEFAFDRSSAPAKGGPKAGGASGSGGISINVHFDKSGPQSGPATIDVTPEKPT